MNFARSKQFQRMHEGHALDEQLAAREWGWSKNEGISVLSQGVQLPAKYTLSQRSLHGRCPRLRLLAPVIRRRGFQFWRDWHLPHWE